MNPLLDFSGLPRFNDFSPEFVTEALDHLLTRNRALIESLLASSVTASWDSFVQPLEDANEHLFRAWGQVAHVNAVMNSPRLREVYNANLPKISQYGAELAQHEGLYSKYKAIRSSPAFGELSPPRQRIIDNRLRDFRLGGAELQPAEKARFKEIAERLSELSSRFSENVLDATNAFAACVSDASELAGLPADAMDAASKSARMDGREGWRFTLHMPSYMPVMQYADNRLLRERMYRAYTTRASDLGDPRLDNSGVISEILALRAEQAALLGYSSFADVSLVPKMAKSPEQVLSFLKDLAAHAKPFAQRDFEDLKSFAKARFGLVDLQAWDIGWVSEKLRIERYSFSEHEVKEYFPEDRVIEGMFQLVERLYGLKVVRDEAPTWHPDVHFYRIVSSDGRIIGQFYLDLYARPPKRGGAWMDDAITRRSIVNGLQTPVAYLNCNFSPPISGKPALFTHDEVTTLFHEFGHGLHHLLTQVDDLAVSGINGVEWDAVELPSQFMENFCWEWDVLKNMTRHVQTGEPLPRALFDKMQSARHFQSGMQTVRQIEFAMFDIRIHQKQETPEAESVLDCLDRVRREVAVVPVPSFNRMPHSFSHIFAGGYAAGYYSYKWAEVLSADAYAMFEGNSVFEAEIGRRFWQEILAVGGSRPALQSFVAFRGREPSIDALLRHSGMVSA
ncbi:MAG: M3 family metallopeptidase [Betaproteobacteria bacterium]